MSFNGEYILDEIVESQILGQLQKCCEDSQSALDAVNSAYSRLQSAGWLGASKDAFMLLLELTKTYHTDLQAVLDGNHEKMQALVSDHAATIDSPNIISELRG